MKPTKPVLDLDLIDRWRHGDTSVTGWEVARMAEDVCRELGRGEYSPWLDFLRYDPQNNWVETTSSSLKFPVTKKSLDRIDKILQNIESRDSSREVADLGITDSFGSRERQYILKIFHKIEVVEVGCHNFSFEELFYFFREFLPEEMRRHGIEVK